jgi:hypothetical protein
MAKVALLIGVGEYDGGLPSLPGTQTDLEAMQRVLQSPEVGGFDVVERLSNPDLSQMQLAIETLFREDRNEDDLILLYFSGHGVRDENGTLYFATCATQKNRQGRIFTSTAVPASFIQTYMSQSRSKRQVLILDCCFSGAFANDMLAKQAADEAVDIKSQLGGEGRVVLTSSTATQVSYEEKGASIYTRYLVQGLETGAADRDGNGQITIDELHEYAREKVQEAAPTMQPEIYAVREGYKILIARAPQGDPKLTYRKELEERAKQKRGRLSPIDQRALKFRWQELGLTSQEAEQIANEVLQPYQAFWAKLQEFEAAIQETLKYDPQISAESLEDLQYLQRILKLRDEDIAPTLATYNLCLTQLEPISQSQSSPTTASANKTVGVPEQDDLSSEKGIDYTRLRDLLKAGDWQEADQETYRVMIRAVGQNEEAWFRFEELLNFPCKDLKTIDHLWIKYSNGKFGFSIQKQIYIECGAILSEYPDSEIWNRFCDRVGWRVQRKDNSAYSNNSYPDYISYSEVTFSISKAPNGHLPFGCGGIYWGLGSFLFFRIQACEE